MRVPAAVSGLAEILKKTALPSPLIRFGEVSVRAARDCSENRFARLPKSDLLDHTQAYVIQVGGAEVQVWAQLYANAAGHYRLFAFSRCEGISGMLFSLNFTTELDAKGIIVLTQRLRFSEGRKTGDDRAGPMRAAKTRLIADILC